MKVLQVLLPIALTVGCATPNAASAMNETERDTICELSASISWVPFGNVSWIEDVEEERRLTNSVNQSEFLALPTSIDCPDGRRQLHDPESGVPFSAIWIARDGSRAAISGGFAGGELFGGGGTCYFRLQENAWVREGCVHEWAI